MKTASYTLSGPADILNVLNRIELLNRIPSNIIYTRVYI